MRRLIPSASPLAAQAGYSRAVVQGDWCFVSGTTGYDYATMTMPDDVAAQVDNALTTIGRVLDGAGFALGDVVRATYYITAPEQWPILAAVTGRVFAAILPAATCIVVDALVAPEMKIEIEVTAFKG